MPSSFSIFLNYRVAGLFYVLYFFALFSSFWINGYVITNSCLTNALGSQKVSLCRYIENKKFNDLPTSFIPEIESNLNGPRSGWITLWNPYNEFGRPTYHLAGFSPAYPLSWLISHITDDSFRFITILSLLNCFMAGFFLLCIFSELQLNPFAGSLIACGFVSSPLVLYWLSFPMVIATFCWTAGVLFALIRLSYRPNLVSLSILTYCCYSLLLTARIQAIVFNFYVVIIFTFFLSFRVQREKGIQKGIIFFVLAISAFMVSCLLVLPIYLDLHSLAAHSDRMSPDLSFFTSILPRINSPEDAIRFIAISTFPEIFGNPISPLYRFNYNGLSLTPFFFFLMLLGVIRSFRLTFGWLSVVFASITLTFFQPIFIFAVKYLGFNFSRSLPLGNSLLPLSIIAAYGAHYISENPRTHKDIWIILSAAIVAGVLLMSVVFGRRKGISISWEVTCIYLLIILFCAVQFDRSRPIFFVAVVILNGIFISSPIILKQNLKDIHRTSLFVQTIRKNLSENSRYAVVGEQMVPLPPNINATLNLASIHTYNSLSSRRYHSLIKELGGQVGTYGRHNNTINPDYDSAAFYLSNIGLVISNKEIQHEHLSFATSLGGLNLYKVNFRMGDVLRTPTQIKIPPEGIVLEKPWSLENLEIKKTTDSGDFLVFEIPGGEPSLLILSQKYHENWKASGLVGSEWEDIPTFPVNGFFQGAYLPECVTDVRFRFEPFARFAWIGHLFFGILALAVIISRFLARNNQTGLSGL